MFIKMISLKSADGECILIDEHSPIYNCDLLISYKVFELTDVINLNYSSEAIKAINSKNSKVYKRVSPCVEICHMCDFIGLHNDYTKNAFNYLVTHLLKKPDENILIENPHFVQYIIKDYPELHLVYDIDEENKDEVRLHPDKYISPLLVKKYNLESYNKYLRVDNVKMVIHMINEYNLDFKICFDDAFVYGSYNVIKYLTKKKVKPTSENYNDIFKNGNLPSCKFLVEVHNPPFDKEWLLSAIANDNLPLLEFLLKHYNLTITPDRTNLGEKIVGVYLTYFVYHGSINCYEFVRNLFLDPINYKINIDLSRNVDENVILKFLQFDEFSISGQLDFILKHDLSLILETLIDRTQLGSYNFSSDYFDWSKFKKYNPVKIYKLLETKYPELHEPYIKRYEVVRCFE